MSEFRDEVARVKERIMTVCNEDYDRMKNGYRNGTFNQGEDFTFDAVLLSALADATREIAQANMCEGAK